MRGKDLDHLDQKVCALFLQDPPPPPAPPSPPPPFPSPPAESECTYSGHGGCAKRASLCHVCLLLFGLTGLNTCASICIAGQFLDASVVGGVMWRFAVVCTACLRRFGGHAGADVPGQSLRDHLQPDCVGHSFSGRRRRCGRVLRIDPNRSGGSGSRGLCHGRSRGPPAAECGSLGKACHGGMVTVRSPAATPRWFRPLLGQLGPFDVAAAYGVSEAAGGKAAGGGNCETRLRSKAAQQGCAAPSECGELVRSALLNRFRCAVFQLHVFPLRATVWLLAESAMWTF